MTYLARLRSGVRAFALAIEQPLAGCAMSNLADVKPIGREASGAASADATVETLSGRDQL
jgi:hypothetical protein